MASRKKAPAKRKKQAAKKRASRPPRLLGVRALAEEIGVSHKAVQRAIEDGRIAPAVVAKPAGRGHPWKIDATKAKRLWRSRTKLTHRPTSELKERAKKASVDELIAPEGEAFQGALPLTDSKDDPLWDSKARKEEAMARLKEMEADKMEGRLILRRQTASAVQRAFTLAREAFLALGPNTSDDLAAIEDPAEVERYLYFKIEAILKEAADAVADMADDRGSRVDGAAA